MADAVYSRLAVGPVTAADLAWELRNRWDAEHGVGSVHDFVREVATCLLHRDDVQVGDLEGGRFLAWQHPPWDADHRIDSELMAMDSRLDDKTRYVFRKKPAS
jgi:hypothetical protein